jgi:hypothetical protein
MPGSGELPYVRRLRTGPVSTPNFNSSSTLEAAQAAPIDWFTGLSSQFLVARTARLLVLAGTERLDKELMIGQMQGKFQMVVVPNVGHMVHEVSGGPISYLYVIDGPAGRSDTASRDLGRVLEAQRPRCRWREEGRRIMKCSPLALRITQT